nr:hypothetical protein [Tanacetum cinerariifolium]
MMKAGFLDSGGGVVKNEERRCLCYGVSPLDATVYDATAGFVKNPSSVNVTVNDGLNKVNDKGFNSTGERRMPASLWSEATGYTHNFPFYESKPTSTNPTNVTGAVKSSTTQDDGDLNKGNMVTIGSTSQANEVIVTPNGMFAVTTVTVIAGIPNEVGHEIVVKDIHASYASIGTFPLSNSFEALNIHNTIIEEVNLRNKASTSGSQEEGNNFTLVVEKINMIEQQLMEGNEDGVESVGNEMDSYLASNPSGVGYDTNSLLKQWRETYENADLDYDPYDDDMSEGQKIPNYIQSICDILDIKVTNILKKDKIEAKTDKTEHEIEKRKNSKSTKSKSTKSKSTKSKSTKVKVKDEAKTE